MLKRHGALSVGAHWRGRESTNAPATPKPILRFDPRHFLAKAGGGRAVIQCRRQDVVFSQGEAADAVFYIQRGKIKLTVVSAHGKEAIIAVFEAGDFFGEGCLAGQPLRMASAMAITDASLLKISKELMRRTLHAQPSFSDLFMSYVLSRNIRVEADLVDHLFNTAEKRLARILLLLAHYGEDTKRDVVIPKISQDVLADMVGTTRSRVNVFMNKFRKLGLIEYDGELKIHRALLNIVLND